MSFSAYFCIDYSTFGRCLWPT